MSGYEDRRAALQRAEYFEVGRQPKPARTLSRWQWCKNALEGAAIGSMIRGLIHQWF